MKRLRVAAAAESDLDEIWFYIAKRSRSIDIADGIVDSITEAFSLLARTPRAGTRRDEIDPGLRSFPVGNYVVYYREVGSRIVVSRVIHGMRDQTLAFFEADPA